MLNIVRTEWLKIKKYPAFWWVMGITALTYPGVNYLFYQFYLHVVAKRNPVGNLAKAVLGNLFSFPESWKTVAYFSSLFVFIPAIVIIMLTTNEYSYKTNRQNVIDGWSRNNFMTGKLIDVVLLSLIITALYAIVAIIIGMVNTPTGSVSKENLTYYIGLFALQSVCQLSLAFLVGFLVRRSFIALAIFAFYYIIIEPITGAVIQNNFHNDADQFLPLQISHRLLPRPSFAAQFDKQAYTASLLEVKYHVGYSIGLLILTWLFCYWLNSRRDL